MQRHVSPYLAAYGLQQAQFSRDGCGELFIYLRHSHRQHFVVDIYLNLTSVLVCRASIRDSGTDSVHVLRCGQNRMVRCHSGIFSCCHHQKMSDRKFLILQQRSTIITTAISVLDSKHMRPPQIRMTSHRVATIQLEHLYRRVGREGGVWKGLSALEDPASV